MLKWFSVITLIVLSAWSLSEVFAGAKLRAPGQSKTHVFTDSEVPQFSVNDLGEIEIINK